MLCLTCYTYDTIWSSLKTSIKLAAVRLVDLLISYLQFNSTPVNTDLSKAFDTLTTLLCYEIKILCGTYTIM